MTRRSTLTALLTLLLLLPAPPAGAATVSEAVDGLDDGVYVESGVSVDRARLERAVDRAAEEGFSLAVVILDDEPSGRSEAFARDVRDRLGRGTVLVLSATGAGMASIDFDSGDVARALDRGLAAGGDAEVVEAVVESLSGATPETTSGGGGGGSTGLIVFLVIVGGLVLLVWWAIRRSRKQSEERRARSIVEARAEIKAQLDAMANVILDITDAVKVSDSREDNTYLEQASATFTEASESFEAAADLAALERLSDRLDEARWQLDAAEAIASGDEVPPKPKKEERHACFFDPTHAGPFEDAEIRTAAGQRTVKVCAADAERLRRGRDPEPRMIEVEGRRVPAPSAPRSHGGGGIDLGGLFSVLVGGAAGRSFDWGPSPRPSRSRRVLPGPRSRRSGGASAGRTRTRSRGGSAGRTRRRRD
jgi:hypothetical protein